MALDLNYTPVEVVDTDVISRDDWLDYRRKGIGGSDVAAIFGVSPWKTGRDLYYEKIGREPVIEDESNWVALEYGTRLEDLVAEIFTFKTGIPTSKDKTMYAHGLFPFMLADVDYFLTLPDGKKAILECKTTAMANRDKWEDGAVPFYYELQVRHYMAVMNIDVAYIACLYGNNDSSFVYQRIERDLEMEEDLIQRETDFWNRYVQPRCEPPYIEEVELVLDSIRRYQARADSKAQDVELDVDFGADLVEYLILGEQKAKLNEKIKQLETRQKELYAPILEQLGSSVKGVCVSRDGKVFEVSYKPSYRTTITRDNVVRLQENFPEVYEKYATTTESRRLLIKEIKEDAA